MPTSGAEPVSRLVLDTSAYSHFRRGHAEVIEALARAERVLVPVTVLGELESAFELGSRVRENRRALDDFLAEAFVGVLDTTASVARHYGRVFSALKRGGTPLPVNDIWIAAATFDCGGTLLTFDRDFERVGGLDVVLLSAGRGSASQ
jgi:predicted nucleic acid-binding protein